MITLGQSKSNVRLGATTNQVDTNALVDQAFSKPVAPAENTSNQSSGTMGNLGRAALSGIIGVGSGKIEDAARLGIINRDTATGWQKQGEEVSQKIASHVTPGLQKELATPSFDDEGNLVHAPSLGKIGYLAAQSAPGMVAMAGGAGALGAGLKAVGVAKRTANVAAGVYGSSAIEGLDAGAQNASQTRLAALSAPIESYRANPSFQKSVAKQDPNLPLEQREELAKKDMADQMANDVYGKTVASTALIGLATGGGVLGHIVREANDATGGALNKGFGAITKNLVKTLGKGSLSEMVQEGPQSLNEAWIQNLAQKEYGDPTTNPMAGVINQGVEGALVGGLTGGLMGGAHATASAFGTVKEPKKIDGEATDMLTGKPIVNKDIAKLINTYDALHSTSPDATSQDYLDQTNAIRNALNEMAHTPEGKVPDHVKVQEAEAALKQIDNAHEVLTRVQRTAAEKEKEAAKPDSSSTPVVEPIVPEAPVVPNTTAQDVNGIFDMFSEAGKEQALQNAADAVNSGNLSRVTYSKPESIAEAKANPNYNTVDNADGTVTAIGVKTADGTWHGTAPYTYLDPLAELGPPPTEEEHNRYLKEQEEKKAAKQAKKEKKVDEKGQMGMDLDELEGLPSNELTPLSKQRLIDNQRVPAGFYDEVPVIPGAPVVPVDNKVVSANNLAMTQEAKAQSKYAFSEGKTNLVTLKSGETIHLVNLQDSNNDGVATAYDSNGNSIGMLSYRLDEYDAEPSITVDENWRRKGVASALYNLAESTNANIPPVESDNSLRSTEGAAFRNGRAAKVKQITPAVNPATPAPKVEVEDNRATLYHATPREFDNLDVSRSTDFGIHLGDEATAKYIAETSDKNNIYSTKIDTSNFIETPDLDSWQTPDVIEAVRDKLNLSDPKKKEYWEAQAKKLTNAYKIARQGKAPKMRIAQVNHDLAKTLSILGVDGIKYINDKEGHGAHSYILLKNPESIQKEGRVEKNREPDVFVKPEVKVEAPVATPASVVIPPKGVKASKPKVKKEVTARASKVVETSPEVQGQIDTLNSVIDDLMARLVIEKDHRLSGGDHIEDMTDLASQVVEATALRDSIIAYSKPKVTKKAPKVTLTPEEKAAKKKSATKNTRAKVIVESDEVDSTQEPTGPSKKELAEIIAESPKEEEVFTPEEMSKRYDLEEELKDLRELLTDRGLDPDEKADARARVLEIRGLLGDEPITPKAAKSRAASIKAELAEMMDTEDLGETVPTLSEDEDMFSYSDSSGNIYEELTVGELRAPATTVEVYDKIGYFNTLKSMLSANTLLDIDLIFVNSFSPEAIAQHSLKIRSNPDTVRGLHIRSSDTGKAKVFINGSLAVSKESMLGTLSHEIIGHYGIRSLFSKHGGYDNFLMNLLSINPAMRKDILSLSTRWSSYLEAWKVDNIPGYSALNHKERRTGMPQHLQKNDLVKTFWESSGIKAIEFDVNKGGILTKEKIPLSISIQLADEYMAELARHYMGDKVFLDREVGMGLKESDIKRRSSLSSQRAKWFNSFIIKVRHLLKSIFGNYYDHISTDSLAKLVAQSIDNTFETINPDALFGSDKPFVSPMVISLENSIDIGETVALEEVLPEDEVINAYTPGRIEDVKVFHDGVMSGFGSQTENVRSRFWNRLNESINNHPILSAFKALGNLNSQQAYEAMGTIFKGEISQAENYVKGFVAATRNLNSMQNQAVFEYFTTKDADPTTLPVTPIQRNAIIKAKESIRTIGKSLNQLGLIDDNVYERNEDAYLHVVYLKYIDQYKGANKKTSLLSWMKKRENKSAREKLALGEIKDVKFLVPETLGTMARDQVLLQMFDTIGQMSSENNLYWVMGRDIKIKYPGRRSKLTLEQAYEQLEQNKFILDMHDKNATQVFGTEGKDQLVEELRRNTLTLETNIQSVESEEAKMLQKAYEAAKAKGETKAEDASKFLIEQYVRLPKKKQMGSLSNKWVRKEIANDLDAITGAYNLSDKDIIEKFFARGGTLERINQLWKMSMVALNPGSWVRNCFGNFSLLDLSTSTNKVKLIGMLHEEIHSAISGEQSEYWKLATKYGLFGSTWSAVELQDLQSTYGSDLADANRRFKARNGGSSLDKQLHFLDERLISVGKMMARKVGAATSKSYSLVEGAFKTVAMRDYINIWEEQNEAEYPGGYKSLNENEAQILLSKAATHANEAIFDYSQVNSMIKTLRRISFGSPFITFTYKAGPAAVRAMVNHPIKFAQYATLPALLTMVAMAFNDWDDDDITKFRSSLTDYQRLNPGITFLPFKDSQGRPQILGLDYMIPWSQYSTAARKIYENYIMDEGESPVATSVKSVGTALNEFGFLGGPTPTGIAAMLSGKDDFTGRDIVTPGASASTQMGEAMLFAYNMATPAWLSSHGWFSKMYDAFKDKPTVDRFGNIKFTPGQAVADITGFRASSVNVQAGIANRRLGFEARLKEVETLRHKIIMDRNITDKIGKIRDLNERSKMIRRQMMDALK